MRLRLAPLALLVLLAIAAPAQAAAPRYILVSGPGLQRPVMLDSWRENLDLIMATVNAQKADAAALAGLHSRPRFDLALFWGWRASRPKWPSQTTQHGSFYPARGTAPAVVVLLAGGARPPRLATPEFLAILKRHHVPVTLPAG
jgi:hypothetical protein